MVTCVGDFPGYHVVKSRRRRSVARVGVAGSCGIPRPPRAPAPTGRRRHQPRVDCPCDLQRRCGCLRPVHGPLLGSARAPVRRPRGGVAGQRALDVGCGPGALTASSSARRPRCRGRRRSFRAVRRRRPGAPSRGQRATRVGRAAAIPRRMFDAALAQLVVHFMADPVAGLGEMARVTRRDGVVAACVWDHAGGHGPLSGFWDAARELDPDVDGRVAARRRARGRPRRAVRRGGAARDRRDVHWRSVSNIRPSRNGGSRSSSVSVPRAPTPRASSPERRADLRERCRERLPEAPFVLTVRAWAARGLA